MNSQPWWVESLGQAPVAGRRLDASAIREQLDRVLTHYFTAKGSPTQVVAPVVREDRWDKSRCPFHQDNRPSASVNWGKSRFKCHACDIGGDAIDLVMEQENLQFREAMEWIEAL